MRHKLFNIFKISLTIIFLASFIFLNNKTYADTFQYSDAVVENLASVVASEIGCADSKDHFVYEMIWAGTFVNQYNFWKERRKTPSTVTFTLDNMCSLFSLGKLYSSNYCYYTYAKRAANRGSDCTQAQKDQLNLAVKMVLSKSFNIPRNIYYAAEAKYANTENNVVWASFQPTVNGKSVGWRTYFSTQNKEAVVNKDLYGNTISTDLEFYKTLANCLYDHPTLFGAYNKCTDGSTPTPDPKPTTYAVYLYPNGGTGISEGQKFEYTETTLFSKFPSVTRSNCTLEGWNVGSVDGTPYYTDIRPSDNGKKLYARWDCDDSSETEKYTVTFKLNNSSNSIYWSEVIKKNETANEPEKKPTKEGYDFIGWITSDGKDFNFKTKITSDITLYAKWNKIENTKKDNDKSNESNNNEKVDNPNTGLFKTTIFLALIIPSMIGVLYYYKYYIKINDNIKS